MRQARSTKSSVIRGLSALLGLPAALLLTGVDCGQSANRSQDTSGSGGIAGGGTGGKTGGGAGGPGGDRFPRCGDGNLDFGEACDDGWRINGNGCNSLCQIEANWECPTPGQSCIKTSLCGNGLVTSDETCDDGNHRDGDGCSWDCQTIESGWQCRAPGRPCSRRPVVASGAYDGGAPPICGDGVVSPGEECDDGNDPSNYPFNLDGAYGYCMTTCKFGPFCGDGIVNGTDEECDLGDGNGMSYGRGGCTAACTNAHFCGDGIVDTDRGEQCDFGDLNGYVGTSCTADCTKIVF